MVVFTDTNNDIKRMDEMKALKVILGTALLALSGIVASNVAMAGNHMKGEGKYLAPYTIKHGKKGPYCKPAYKIVWKNHKAWCVNKKKIKNYVQNNHSNVIWTKVYGKAVPTCRNGYKLFKRPNGKYKCVKKPRGNGYNGLNKKYDQYLYWSGHKADCKKGKFWVGPRKQAHCSSK